MTGRGWPLGLAAVLAALAAAPARAEGPPPGFTGAQYVDAQGCVFARGPQGWAPRRNRDGSPVCGYPPAAAAPTETATTADAADAAVGAPSPAPSEPAAEAEPIPGAASSAPPPAPLATPAQATLPQATLPRATPALATPAGSPLAPPVLDLPPPRQAPPLPDADPARASTAPPAPRPTADAEATDAEGCALIALSPEGRIAAGPRRDYLGPPPPRDCRAPAPDGFAPAPLAGPVAGPVAGRLGAPPLRRAQTRRSQPAPAQAQTAPPRSPDPAPGHRYVQVGSYGEPMNGTRALSRILGMGLPAARGKGRIGGQAVQVIYAGPFDDPAALRAALVRLRAVGYADAFTR